MRYEDDHEPATGDGRLHGNAPPPEVVDHYPRGDCTRAGLAGFLRASGEIHVDFRGSRGRPADSGRRPDRDRRPAATHGHHGATSPEHGPPETHDRTAWP